MSTRNVLKSAAFVMCNRGLATNRHNFSGPVVLCGCVMMLMLVLLTCTAWTARIAALQVKADFESSLASVRSLADQSWMFTSDLEERINSMQRCVSVSPNSIGHLLCTIHVPCASAPPLGMNHIFHSHYSHYSYRVHVDPLITICRVARMGSRATIVLHPRSTPQLKVQSMTPSNRWLHSWQLAISVAAT